MSLTPELLQAIDARKKRVLLVAQAAMPLSQFEAYRKIFLDEFGHSGLETDVSQIVADHERKRQGKEQGRPTYAGKEVPHAWIKQKST